MIDPLFDAPSDSERTANVTLLDVDSIVLDIDDTLYLERDYARSGFIAVDRWAHQELGTDDFGSRAWAAFEAGARGKIFNDVLIACGKRPDDAIVSAMVRCYRTHLPDIALASDARKALDRWHGAVLLAAVTDGPLPSQHAKARALALDRWIPQVVFTAALDEGMSKPHPAAFEMVQDRLGVSSGRCVYIADNPAKDFVAPKQLGWRTVRVRRLWGLHAEAASGADVDHEIVSLDQLELTVALSDP
jgi:putative hydrolase of the HAD superfamily